MERRKFIIGAGALATGSSAAVGTGAVSRTQADREMTINVANDSSGYIGFNTGPSGVSENRQFASIEEGEVTINFGETNDGDGLNPNSRNFFDDVFSMNNQANEDLEVWFELDDDLEGIIDFYAIAGNDGRDGNETDRSLVGNPFGPGPNAMGVGDSGLRVGIEVDLTGYDSDQTISGDVTVIAETVE